MPPSRLIGCLCGNISSYLAQLMSAQEDKKPSKRSFPAKKAPLKFPEEKRAKFENVQKFSTLPFCCEMAIFLRNEYFGGVRKVGDNFLSERHEKNYSETNFSLFWSKPRTSAFMEFGKCIFFNKMPFLASYSFIFFSNEQLEDNFLRMLGFEPWISDVGSARSTNWATNTALC